jgi:hypothetical protein
LSIKAGAVTQHKIAGATGAIDFRVCRKTTHAQLWKDYIEMAESAEIFDHAFAIADSSIMLVTLGLILAGSILETARAQGRTADRIRVAGTAGVVGGSRREVGQRH